jgi:hypothetical protein
VRATIIPQIPAKIPNVLPISLGKQVSGGTSMYSVQIILICIFVKQGGNSQNYLHKFEIFFLTFGCFYVAIIYENDFCNS